MLPIHVNTLEVIPSCYHSNTLLTLLSEPPQMEDDSIYNRSQTRAFPFPPLLPLSHDTEMSELYQVSLYHPARHSRAVIWGQIKLWFLKSQMVLKHSRYPPILRTDTRTLAAPFKEQHTHRSACESVGNNYSPQAQDLKMVQLQHRPPTVQQTLEKAAAPRILSCFCLSCFGSLLWYDNFRICWLKTGF